MEICVMKTIYLSSTLKGWQPLKKGCYGYYINYNEKAGKVLHLNVKKLIDNSKQDGFMEWKNIKIYKTA